MSQLSSTRYNVTAACDSCKELKIKCCGIPCTECIKRDHECTISKTNKKRGPKPDYEKFLDPEEIKCLENLFGKERLPHIFKILNSTSHKPCPYKNVPGHNYCHEGFIYNSLHSIPEIDENLEGDIEFFFEYCVDFTELLNFKESNLSDRSYIANKLIENNNFEFR
ncbi:11163_t:CDS:2 [Scutellospora calospora]|uniref:11163_t:CDS:1 n=1 Tax=Scutellospora calospora TaxID=85575 RepID=A0ACA9JXE0_9GLOM|nr:11163_t:CDS:2 [Scutellospora calospora]